MTVTEARAQFAEVVNQVAYTGEPVVLTRRGRPMVVMLSAAEYEMMRRLLAERIELTEAAGPVPMDQGHRQHPGPLHIAAEYRPHGPSRPTGFGR